MKFKDGYSCCIKDNTIKMCCKVFSSLNCTGAFLWMNTHQMIPMECMILDLFYGKDFATEKQRAQKMKKASSSIHNTSHKISKQKTFLLINTGEIHSNPNLSLIIFYRQCTVTLDWIHSLHKSQFLLPSQVTAWCCDIRGILQIATISWNR